MAEAGGNWRRRAGDEVGGDGEDEKGGRGGWGARERRRPGRKSRGGVCWKGGRGTEFKALSSFDFTCRVEAWALLARGTRAREQRGGEGRGAEETDRRAGGEEGEPGQRPTGARERAGPGRPTRPPRLSAPAADAGGAPLPRRAGSHPAPRSSV